MPTVKLPYSPSRGALAGQTFFTKQSYNEALARSKGFAGETGARSAAVRKPVSELTREEMGLYNKSTRVASRVARGESLDKAAKAEGIRPETVRKYRPDALEKHKSGYLVKPLARAWSGPGTVWVQVLTSEGPQMRAIPRRGDRAQLARYLNTVRGLLSPNDATRSRAQSELKAYAGKYVTDADGNRIPFITDEAQLRRLAEDGELSFEELYSEFAGEEPVAFSEEAA